MADARGSFFDNIKKVKNWTDKSIVRSMRLAQNLVIEHAQARHGRRPPGGGHPSKRFYTISSKLVNSIRPGEVKADQTGIIGEVLAGGTIPEGIVDYAPGIEKGTATHRAYPFLVPALVEQKKPLLGRLAIGVEEALKG